MFGRGLSFFLGSLGFSLALCVPSFAKTPAPREVVRSFAPFAVSEKFRHRWETAEVEGKTLTLNLWYEDSSVTKTGIPSDSLFCRISHMMIFGRHLERSSARGLPLDVSFRELPEIDQVRLQFFALIFSNKARPGSKPSSPRVEWTREETPLVYLSYTLSRGEWKTLSSQLKGQKNPNFETYREGLCGNVLKVAPNLRANFQLVQEALQKSRGSEGAP